MSNSNRAVILQYCLYLIAFHIEYIHPLTGSTYNQIIFIGKTQRNNMIIVKASLF